MPTDPSRSKGMRRPRLRPATVLAKARQCIDQIAFEPHFEMERADREIRIQDICEALRNKTARVGLGDRDTRYLSHRQAWSYRIYSRCRRGDLVVVITFYLPEEAIEPDTVSIITAYCTDTEDGRLPP